MKKKILIASILLALSTAAYSSAWGDMRYIDQLVQNKEYDIAKEELLDFLGKYQSSKKYYPIALDRLAKIYYLDKNYAESRKYFKEYLKGQNLKEDERQEGIYNLIRTDIELGEFEEAKTYADYIVSEKKYMAFFQLGKAFYDKEDYNTAQVYFRRLLKFDSDYYLEGLLYLSLTSYKESEYLKSIVFGEEYTSRAENQDKNLALINYILGSSHFKISDTSVAENYFKTVEEKHPKSEYSDDAKYQLFKLYVTQKQSEKYSDYFEKLKGTEYEKQGYLEMAKLYFSEENYSDAEKYYSVLAEKDSGAEIVYGYAQTLLKQDKNQEALEQFRKLKSTKYDSEYYYYSSYILYNSKKYKDVLALLSNFEKLDIKDDYLKNIETFVATSAYEVGRYGTAKRYFEKAYSEEKTKKNLYKLILVNSKLKKMDELRKNFDTYEKKYPKDIKYSKNIHLLIGNAYFELGQYNNSEKLYEAYLDENFDEKVLNSMIMTLSKQGKYNKLLTYLEKAEPSVKNIYLKGTAYLGINEYQQAEKALLWVTSSSKATRDEKEKASFRLIKNYLAWEKYEKAIDYGEKYLNNYKKRTYEANDMMAVAYFKMGSYKNARSIYKKFLDSPKWADYGEFQIAETYYNEEDYDKSKEHYGQLIAKNSEYAEDSLYWIINIEYYLGNFAEAFKRADEFKEKFPESEYNKDIAYIKGEIYIAKNQNTKAVSEYEELYKSTKEFNLGQKTAEKLMTTYYDMGEYSKSIKWAGELRDEKKAQLWKANAYEKQGKTAEALNIYEKLKKDKNYGDRANFELGEYYEKQKNTEKALAYYGQVSEFDSSAVKDKAIFKMGEIHFRNKNYVDSLKAFMKIRVLYENSKLRETAMIRIAKIYEIQNEEDKSLKMYLELYEDYNNSKYYSYFIKKILAAYLKQDKRDIAQNYYSELKKIDVNEAEQFKKYFSN